MRTEFLSLSERGAASSADRPAVIVVAQSARALAAAVRRAGYAALAVDLFGDADTRESCLATVTLEGGLSCGLRARPLVEAVASLSAAYRPIGVVYGSGLEDQPETIAALARLAPLIGNDAATVARAKDPVGLAALSAGAAILHPEIAWERPRDAERWLEKQSGGSGGVHVREAPFSGETSPRRYFQRRLGGRSVSALFVADGETAQILGLSEQWAAPTARSPFRYGGAVGPIQVGAAESEEIARAVAAATREFGLKGLASADFLIADESVWLIEINPRPGATLDVFDSDEDPLFARHVAALQGTLTPAKPMRAASAAQIVFAASPVTAKAGTPWPDWAADRPTVGTHIAADEPLCTARASAPTVEAAKRLVAERARRLVEEFAT